jgi:NADPH:quinone reductase-like Zn-dependent oxidoreductase
MKTHSRFLNTAINAAALLFTSVAWAQTPSPTAAVRMKAYVSHEFGSPDVLKLEEIEKPVPKDNQALVKIRAVSVNPLDWHFMEGTPYIGRLPAFGLLKPRLTRLGVDFAGTVEAVGKDVKEFKPGDEVYGNKFGACAEYITATEATLVMKPSILTFEQAASLPVAAMTALQALRDYGKLQPGQRVLINGASGGVGTFAVQIAKAFGAEVTGVCSGRNVELVRSLGADHVIDYTKEDFTQRKERYDLILDNVGSQPLSGFRRVLTPTGKYIVVGGGGVKDSRWTGPLVGVIKC